MSKERVGKKSSDNTAVAPKEFGATGDRPAISCERPLRGDEVRKRAQQPLSWHAPLARLGSRVCGASSFKQPEGGKGRAPGQEHPKLLARRAHPRAATKER